MPKEAQLSDQKLKAALAKLLPSDDLTFHKRKGTIFYKGFDVATVNLNIKVNQISLHIPIARIPVDPASAYDDNTDFPLTRVQVQTEFDRLSRSD